MTRAKGRALLIIPYFGTFGPWFPIYLRSLANQNTLDLLLITDADLTYLPKNVRVLKSTLPELQAMAEEKFGTKVSLPTARYLCDLKPAYGRLFDEYLDGYEYWAFGDEDVIYGDLDHILMPLLDGRTDVLTADRKGTLGHLTVLRNTEKLRKLVFEDEEYLRVLASDDFWAYDEWSWTRTIENPSSFTRTVKTAERRGEISVSWEAYKIRGDVPWPGEGMRYDGKSICSLDGDELAYFHWGRAKNKYLKYRRLFRFPTVQEAEGGFVYDRFGFYYPTKGFGQEWLRRIARRADKWLKIFPAGRRRNLRPAARPN